MNSQQRGFTLIELLVVIAIIGILSSVVLASLNNARQKARVASAQASVKSAQAAAVLCMDAGSALNSPATPGTTLICAGASSTWPTLPTVGTWTYGTSGTTPAGCTAFDGTVSDGTFNFCVAGEGTTEINCNQDRCVTT